MTVTLKCGCVVWVDHFSASGCCCGECYIEYGCEAEGGEIETACTAHGG